MNPTPSRSPLPGNQPPDSTAKHARGCPKERPAGSGRLRARRRPNCPPRLLRFSGAKKPSPGGPPAHLLEQGDIRIPPSTGFCPNPASPAGSAGVDGTAWNTDGGKQVATQKSTSNERPPLEVAHKRPLGGFVMTRRRPRVDNPSRTPHRVRKDSGSRNLGPLETPRPS